MSAAKPTPVNELQQLQLLQQKNNQLTEELNKCKLQIQDLSLKLEGERKLDSKVIVPNPYAAFEKAEKENTEIVNEMMKAATAVVNSFTSRGITSQIVVPFNSSMAHRAWFFGDEHIINLVEKRLHNQYHCTTSWGKCDDEYLFFSEKVNLEAKPKNCVIITLLPPPKNAL